MFNLYYLDYIVICLFLFTIGSISYSTRLKRNTIVQFLVAGRKLTLPLYTASFISCWYGGILGIGEAIQQYGIGAFALFLFPYYFFTAIYALFLAKKVRQKEQISIPERLAKKFDKKAGLIGSIIVYFLSLPAPQILMFAILVQMLTSLPLWICLIVTSVVSAALVNKGGMLTDAKVSMVGSFLVIIGFLAMFYKCLTLSSPMEVLKSLPESHGSLLGGHDLLGYASYFILGLWILASPHYHQKACSAIDEVTSQRGMLLALIATVMIDSMVMYIGLYAIHQIPFEGNNPIAQLPLAANYLLPSGFKAIFICGLMTAILSDIVGNLLINGTTIGSTVIRYFRPISEGQQLENSRFFVIISAVLATIIILIIPSVTGLWYIWAGSFVGALLLPTLISYTPLSSYFSSKAVNSSLIFSLLVSTSWTIYCLITQNDFVFAGLKIGTVVPGLGVSGLILGPSFLGNNLDFLCRTKVENN